MTAGKIVVQVFSVGSFFLIINVLTLKEYGLLQLLFTALGPGTVIAMLGIERLLVADGAVYRSEGKYSVIKKLFAEYAVTTTVLLSVVVVSAWFFHQQLSEYLNFDFGVFYWPVVALLVGQIVMNFCSISYEVYERFDLSVYSAVGEAIARLICIGTLFLFFEITVETVVWAYAVSKLVAGTGGSFLSLSLLRSYAHTMYEGNVLLSIIRRHGKWEMISKVFQSLSDSFVPWLIAYFTTLEGVAMVTFAQRINSFCISIFPARAVLFPILTHSIATSKDLAAIIASKVKKYLIALYAVFYIVIWVGLDSFIALAAPQYAGASPFVRLALLHLFLDVFTLGQGPAFYALKKQKFNFVMNMYTFVATIITQVLFIYLWGTAGFFLSMLFITASQLGIREYVLITRYNSSLINMRALLTFDEHDRRIFEEAERRIRSIFSRA